jgi:hypothetical protein
LRRVFKAWADKLPGSITYQVTISRKRAKRSIEQNSLFHVLVGQLASHLGYTPDELKDVLKHMYGRKKLVEMAGERTMVPVSTTEYTKAEMSDMIEHIYRLAAEYGAELEAPE